MEIPSAEDTPQGAVQSLLTGWFKNEFADAVDDTRTRVNLNKLTEFIEDGDGKKVVTYLQAETFDLANNIASLTASAGIAAAEAEVSELQTYEDAPSARRRLIKKANVRFVFNRADPNFVNAMNNHRITMIKEMTDNQLKTIKDVLDSSVARPGQVAGVFGEYAHNPRSVAREFRDAIGLTANQSRAVRNYRTALVSDPKKALMYKLRDGRHDSVVARAAKTGKPLTSKQINEFSEQYRKRYVAYRAETIARTEMIRVANEGQHAVWNQAKKSGKFKTKEIRRFWSSANDDRTRQSHREIPALNKEGVGIDEKFKTPFGLKMKHPGDPSAPAGEVINCRCTVVTRVLRRKKKKESVKEAKRRALNAAANALPKRAERTVPKISRSVDRLKRLDAKVPLPTNATPVNTATSSYVGSTRQVGRVQLQSRMTMDGQSAVSNLSVSDYANLQQRVLVNEPAINAQVSPTINANRSSFTFGDFVGDQVAATKRASKVVRGIGERRWNSLPTPTKLGELKRGLGGERFDIVRESVKQGKQAIQKLPQNPVINTLDDKLDDVNAFLRGNSDPPPQVNSLIKRADESFGEPMSENLVLYADDLVEKGGYATNNGFLRSFPTPDVVKGRRVYRISNTKNRISGVKSRSGENVISPRGNQFRIESRVTESDGVELIDVIPTGKRTPKSIPSGVDGRATLRDVARVNGDSSPQAVARIEDVVNSPIDSRGIVKELGVSDDVAPALSKAYNDSRLTTRAVMQDSSLFGRVKRAMTRYDNINEIPDESLRKVARGFLEDSHKFPSAGTKRRFGARLIKPSDRSPLMGGKGGEVGIGDSMGLTGRADAVADSAKKLTALADKTDEIVVVADRGNGVVAGRGGVMHTQKQQMYHTWEFPIDAYFNYTSGQYGNQYYTPFQIDVMNGFGEALYGAAESGQDISQAIRFIELGDAR